MALASIEATKISGTDISKFLFSPMIDARRQEVFTALYDSELQNVLAPFALVLDEYSFATELEKHPIVFSGNGSIKLKGLIRHENAIFSNSTHQISQLSHLSVKAFIQNKFSDLAYSEPFYLKEFYDASKKKI